MSIMGDLEPPKDTASLLTHREVVKLFHVFGSSLRDLFCEQPEGVLSGTTGLEIDIIELPAYFLERWAFDRQVLSDMSCHYKSGDAMPSAAIDALADSRNFLAGMRILRQTARAHIDLELHADYDPYSDINVFDLAKLVEAEYSVIRPRVQDRELCSWPFNTDVAGAFYGQLWAEALAADVFSAFEAEAGEPSESRLRSLGDRFRRNILKPGGGRAPGAALQDFLQRPPAFTTFLKSTGLEGSAVAEEPVPLEDTYEEYSDDAEFEDDDSYAEFEDAEDTYLSDPDAGGSASGPG